MRLRGIKLPGWSSLIGHATTQFWTEVYQRQQGLDTSRVNLDVFGTYVMAGLPQTVDLGKRLEALEPYVKEVMAKIDHTAYTPQHTVAVLAKQLQAQHEKLAGLKYVKWLSSDDFDLDAWLNGTESY